MVINEESLQVISSKLRSPLERIYLDGVDEWNPIFSNGYGFGHGKLVIRMKPVDDVDFDINEVDVDYLLAILRSAIDGIGSVEELEIIQKKEYAGFFLVMELQ